MANKKRVLECEACGHEFWSAVQPENVAKGKVKCPECGKTSMIDRQDQPQPCLRCGGDGVFHSSRTGVRARTATESLVDTSKPCIVCNGTGVAKVKKDAPDAEREGTGAT